MTWIMIFAMWDAGSRAAMSLGTQEFNDEKSCVLASIAYSQMVRNANKSSIVTCVAKGKGK